MIFLSWLCFHFSSQQRFQSDWWLNLRLLPWRSGQDNSIPSGCGKFHGERKEKQRLDVQKQGPWLRTAEAEYCNSWEAALPLLQILPSKSHHAVALGNILLCLRTSLVPNSTQARFQTGSVPISDTSVAPQHQHHFENIQKSLAGSIVVTETLLA